jgi:hypothetical protein
VPFIREYAHLVNENHIPQINEVIKRPAQALQPEDIFYFECAMQFPAAILPAMVDRRFREFVENLPLERSVSQFFQEKILQFVSPNLLPPA